MLEGRLYCEFLQNLLCFGGIESAVKLARFVRIEAHICKLMRMRLKCVPGHCKKVLPTIFASACRIFFSNTSGKMADS